MTIQGLSSFTAAQKAAIKAEMDKMTETGIDNDIWGTAFNMMKNLEANALFSSGAYSVIMNQSVTTFYGYVCRVDNGFYNSFNEIGPIFTIGGKNKGSFCLFKIR